MRACFGRRSRAAITVLVAIVSVGCASTTAGSGRRPQPASLNGATRGALPPPYTNRLVSSGDGVCAVFSAARHVHCWGFDAQICGDTACPKRPEVLACRGSKPSPEHVAGRASTGCAVRPVARPLLGAVRVFRRGLPVCAGMADGECACAWLETRTRGAPQEQGRPSSECKGALEYEGATALYSDGTVVDHAGLSAVAPDPDGPRKVHLDARFSHVARGRRHTCGTTDGGAVYCWGENLDKELGIGNRALERCAYFARSADSSDGKHAEDVDACTDTPLQVAGLHLPARHLSASGSSTCATLQDGSVWCWGELADGRGAAEPEAIKGLERTRSTTLGGHFGCALREDGSVWCWGGNKDGVLGDGSNVDRLHPGPVQNLARVVEISAGQRHVCAVTEDRALYCWGNNDYGQLGNGTFDSSNTPVQVQPPGTISPIWHTAVD